jgi:indolepyruvate ferredoxin oxidoreductase alpha subunit
LKNAIEHPKRDVNRIVLPPSSYLHEQEKIKDRWPAAVKFIQEHQINEFFSSSAKDFGIVLQGGMYNGVLRALEVLGLADAFGESKIPLYVLNVTYPLVDDEFKTFCTGKRGLLIVEEGQPDFIEQNIHAILRKADLQTRVHGKEFLPMAGEYTGGVILQGVKNFVERYAPELLNETSNSVPADQSTALMVQAVADATAQVLPRPPSFCTGCPERPIFTAIKLLEKELGPRHISCDIGCHLFSILPPFNIGATTMGYGLGWAGASAFNTPETEHRTMAIMGDGGFWHNGLTSGVGNAVFNQTDNVLLVVDNGYSAATGGQDVLSSKAINPIRSTNNPIEKAVKGVGVDWVKTVTHTYNLDQMRGALRDALTTQTKGPKVVVAQSECMLNRQRRVKPQIKQRIKQGERVVREKFGVDPDTCTGDHSCIRLSGCPSLSIKTNPDPLRTDPVVAVADSCVGCGLCGEVAHAAVLCPSFYRAEIINNPSGWDRFKEKIRHWVIGRLQSRIERRLEGISVAG